MFSGLDIFRKACKIYNDKSWRFVPNLTKNMYFWRLFEDHRWFLMNLAWNCIKKSRKAAFKGQEVQNKGKMEALDRLNTGAANSKDRATQRARATGRGKPLRGLVIRGLLISQSIYTPWGQRPRRIKSKQNKRKQNNTKQNQTSQPKPSQTKQNKIKQSKTKQSKTKQNKTNQIKTKQNKTKET